MTAALKLVLEKGEESLTNKDVVKALEIVG